MGRSVVQMHGMKKLPVARWGVIIYLRNNWNIRMLCAYSVTAF